MVGQSTIHVCSSFAMTNEALRGPLEIIKADTETNLLNHLFINGVGQYSFTSFETLKALTYLVGVLLIDVVLNSMHALLVEVLRGDLDQIRDFCLEFWSASPFRAVLGGTLTG